MSPSDFPETSRDRGDFRPKKTLQLTMVAALVLLVAGDPETNLLNSGCSTVKNTNATLFRENLNRVFASLRGKIASNGFGTDQQLTGSDPVYGLGQCRRDKSSADCLKCFTVAVDQVRNNCTNVTGGRVIYDGCFLRYERNNFFSQDTFPSDTQLCGSTKITDGPSEFQQTSLSLLTDLCTATPRTDDFFGAQTRKAESSNRTIYALAQCIRSASESGCRQCLSIANSNIKNCLPNTEGRAVDVGCYLRYATYSFFPANATIDLASFLSSGGKSSKSKIGIIVGVVGGAILVSALVFWVMFRRSGFAFSVRREKKEGDIIGATELRGPTNFRYNVLRDATRNFDTANKLGEGGFGEVYKGTLSNGKIIAVKKLSLVQSQCAIAEFESKVRLITNVHHRNLVRLLGCCNKGPERLLVYEYMPNSSLDRVLFGSPLDSSSGCKHINLTFFNGENRGSLSWQRRFDIILGTARGLAYLHEDFHVRIIHRDIKCSNILLDENLYPKIADFGLARLLPGDRSHLSTRFAGTLGYTAPEYAIYGQLTEKADTFSFGVVVLEIISGRKSIDMRQPLHMQYLLGWVWKLYETDKVLDIVDDSIKSEAEDAMGEILRLIQLALHCAQASAAQRPSMSEVVAMLVSKTDIHLQQPPMQPAFIDVAYGARGDQSSSTGTTSSQSKATASLSLSAR